MCHMFVFYQGYQINYIRIVGFVKKGLLKQRGLRNILLLHLVHCKRQWKTNNGQESGENFIDKLKHLK